MSLKVGSNSEKFDKLIKDFGGIYCSSKINKSIMAL